MSPYAILGLLVLGHLCQIQAATLSKPPTSTDDARKLLTEKLSRFIMEHREELIEVLKGVDSTGDGTDEQGFPLVIAAILASILTPAMAVGAGAIGTITMKTSLVLVLFVLGLLCQVQAAAIEKPEISVDAIEKFVGEKVTRALLSENRDVVEAVKVLKATLKTFGDDDSEHFFPLIIAAVTGIIRAINWTR